MLSIKLTSQGKVISAKVIQSSGDNDFDRSAEDAVWRASPLPMPPDPEVQETFRSFNFRFKPGG